MAVKTWMKGDNLAARPGAVWCPQVRITAYDICLLPLGLRSRSASSWNAHSFTTVSCNQILSDAQQIYSLSVQTTNPCSSCYCEVGVLMVSRCSYSPDRQGSILAQPYISTIELYSAQGPRPLTFDKSSNHGPRHEATVVTDSFGLSFP